MSNSTIAATYDVHAQSVSMAYLILALPIMLVFVVATYGIRRYSLWCSSPKTNEVKYSLDDEFSSSIDTTDSFDGDEFEFPHQTNKPKKIITPSLWKAFQAYKHVPKLEIVGADSTADQKSRYKVACSLPTHQSVLCPNVLFHFLHYFRTRSRLKLLST